MTDKKGTPTYAEVACVRAGLPMRYADRLRGETFKELYDDAVSMKTHYRAYAPPLGNPDPRPNDDPRSQQQLQATKLVKQFADAFREAEQVRGSEWVPLIFDD